MYIHLIFSYIHNVKKEKINYGNTCIEKQGKPAKISEIHMYRVFSKVSCRSWR
jgi:hypothetical protein